MTFRRWCERIFKNEEWIRYQWWPVRIVWGFDPVTVKLLGWGYICKHWVDWHGIEVAPDRVHYWQRSPGYMPGFRKVLKQVYHFGPLRIVMGHANGTSPDAVEVEQQAALERADTEGRFQRPPEGWQ